MTSTTKEFKSPLADFYIQQNFLSAPLNGESIIPFYSNSEQEYNAITHGVAYYDRSNCTLIELTGKEVLDFLNRISTNECLTIQRGSSKRTIFTTEKGRILDSVLAINLGDNQFLLGNKTTNSKLVRWIDRYIIMDDVKLIDLTGKMGVIEILGPQAESFLILLFGDVVKSILEDGVKRIEFEEASLFLCRTKNLNDEETFILFGEFPYIQKALLFSRINKNVFNFSLAGENAYESNRIENGIPNQNELNDSFNPHEALLRTQISFTKGCYIGQEVIARLDTYEKVQRSLVKLEFDRQPLIQNFSVKDENEIELLQVTSVAYSFSNQKYIGLGYLRKNISSEQTKFTDVVDGITVQIQVQHIARV